MNRKQKVIKLRHGESIRAAVAARVSGPGWFNEPLFVIIRSNDGKYREECIQPSEMTTETAWLFSVAYAAHEAFLSSIPVKASK